MISDVLSDASSEMTRELRAMPRLLDLFCGAGGAAMGYARAGFLDIVGVDRHPMPRYPFAFVQGDALEYLAAHGDEFDVIHASPECQGYSPITPARTRSTYLRLVTEVRQRLTALGRPFVIENVMGARHEMRHPLLLCGSMFDLKTPCQAELRRHRLFESNILLMSPGHCQHGKRTIMVNGHEFRNEALQMQHRRTITVTGSTPQRNVVRNQKRETFSIADARIAMGISWMTRTELSQAIPPAYTEWIGQQLITTFRAQYGAS
jgi:DNA (cytosine-5)-methyltransferase 1